uniref:Uncharacterized protein n=1 Tax=Lygus hesperus TaxID=30085 RepID=A0A146M5U8_LYGHE
MIAFFFFLVVTAGSLAEGGSIGNRLHRVNQTMQTVVSDVGNTVNQVLDLGNNTVSSGADLVSSGSNQLTNVGINGLDAVADIAQQGWTIQQDTVNSVLNIANSLPVWGKIVSKPNGVISEMVNASSDLGRNLVNFGVGSGQAGLGISNAGISIAAETAASAASEITGKLKGMYGKGSNLISNGISSGIESTSSALQKIGGLF